jgi:hypothetical protein
MNEINLRKEVLENTRNLSVRMRKDRNVLSVTKAKEKARQKLLTNRSKNSIL